MMDLLLKFTFAHLIGDFVFQPNAWVEDKKRHKIKSKFLYVHTFIHFLLLLIVTAFDLKYFFGILVLTFSHFAIDTLKLYFERKKFGQISFFVDQTLHLLMIVATVNYFYPLEINFVRFLNEKNILLATALVFVSFVTAVILKISLKDLNPNKKEKTNNAGKYIGILERLFIFLFVVINFWEGIGFLLAAKSIFRFGDLKENKDIRLTEYILIGTLLSFGIGILTGMAYLEISEMLISSTN